MFCILIQVVDTQVGNHVNIRQVWSFKLSELYWMYLYLSHREMEGLGEGLQKGLSEGSREEKLRDPAEHLEPQPR